MARHGEAWLGMGGLQLFNSKAVLGRCRLLMLAGIILHITLISHADEGGDPEFTMFDGYIAGDGDLKSEFTTIVQAKTICVEQPSCKGFTFMGKPSEDPMWINFKVKWNIGGTGWTSYRREELPFKMFDGFISGEPDVAKEYMTLRQAKVRCIQLPDCKGFTFMGGPSDGPMWVNFKAMWNIGGTGWTSYRREPDGTAAPTGETDAADPAPAADASASSSQMDDSAQQEANPKSISSAAKEAVAKDVPPAEEPAAKETKDKPLLEIKEPAAKETKDKPLLEIKEYDVGNPHLSQQEDADVSESSVETLAPSSLDPAPEQSTVESSAVSMEVTPHADLNAVVEDAPSCDNNRTAKVSEYIASLFLGDLMKKTQQNVVALDTERVVMCFTEPAVGGACRATLREKNGTEVISDTNDTRFLPPLSWGADEVFLEGEAGRIETVRLNSDCFVICFVRVLDSAVICTLGLVDAGSEGLRLSFGNSLQLGFGRLISVAPAAAGRQLVACYAPKGETGVTCRWAHTAENTCTLKEGVHCQSAVKNTGSQAVELRWAEGNPLTLDTKSIIKLK